MKILNLSKQEVREGYLIHAAMTQLHRWFLIYENPEIGIKNQLDILDDDIHVISSLGEGRGHTEYKQRVGQLPKSWKNAHFLLNSQIMLNKDGSSDLNFEINYLNHGMKTDGTVRQAGIAYSTKLQKTAGVLPQFTNIEIKQLNEGEVNEFTSAYAANRLESLVHYWLALVEDPNRSLKPFKEILAVDFELNFSSGVITDFKAFEKWYKGPASSVEASTHVMSNFSYEEVCKNEYSLQVDFDWQGMLPSGQELVGKTRHKWLVSDKVTDRFARIKKMEVELLIPFQPRK